jgi:hypothetical protein
MYNHVWDVCVTDTSGFWIKWIYLLNIHNSIACYFSFIYDLFCDSSKYIWLYSFEFWNDSIFLRLYNTLLDLSRFISIFIFLYTRYDSLDGRSARPKAATFTHDNTNAE